MGLEYFLMSMSYIVVYYIAFFMEVHMIKRIPSSEWINLKSHLSEYWAEIYFLLHSLENEKQLKDVFLSEENGQITGLLALRKSNKAHFHCTDRISEEWLEYILKLAIESLLVSSRVAKLIASTSLEFDVNTTSTIMTATSHQSNNSGGFLCLTQEHLVIVDEFYKQHMSGALSLERMKRNFRHHGYGIGIFEENDLIAVAQVCLVNQNQAFVFGVVVHPKYRGQGLGKLVMHGLLAHEKTRDKTLHLLTNNPIAVNLYEELGFHRVGEMLELKWKGSHSK
jgi:GNAT superfamily N-acetyltransferase